MKFIVTCMLALCLSWALQAKEYHASLFGVKSDGVTLNSSSIQKAVDFIQEKGGGTLVFSVGRYLTGSIRLKSNVMIELREGAVLVGVASLYDYVAVGGVRALIVAEGAENIGVFGKGVIEGQGKALLASLSLQIQKGYVSETIAKASPALIAMKGCKSVTVKGLHIQDAAGDALSFSDCGQVILEDLWIRNKAVPNMRGLVYTNCPDLLATRVGNDLLSLNKK
jgi:polygalacturonase